MISNSSLLGLNSCLSPFLAADLYPSSGGFVGGRFCSDMLGPTCCLPCPATEWFYPDNFDTITQSASWINVGGMVCSVFLLASFAFLPIDKTHRHYLSVCLAFGIVLMQLGFIVPLGANPEKCYNHITPNDMKSSKTCALSGAFILIGGWSAVVWVFLRAVALHLQICWQVVIGKTFMWGALATGWGIPAIALTVALIFSGVSFRFGDTCHINHKNSLADFWIPLLVFAAFTVIVQFSTFGYCIKVYLASLVDDSTTTNSSGALPSYTSSIRGTISPKQAYRRVRRVIELQWRGITIVLLIIADVVFFAIVFVFMDDTQRTMLKVPTKSLKWLECLVESGGDKNKCVGPASHLVVNEPTVMAVLILLSMNGIWCLLLLGRMSMVTGWYEMIRGKVKPGDNEFVSADVSRHKDPTGSYEMLSRDRETSKTPEHLVAPAGVTPLFPVRSPSGHNGRKTPDYFGREERYKSPTHSFSAPKAPPRTVSWGSTTDHLAEMTWNSIDSHAAPSEYPRTYKMDPLNMNNI